MHDGEPASRAQGRMGDAALQLHRDARARARALGEDQDVLAGLKPAGDLLKRFQRAVV